jgi:hypothetical protein
VLDSGRDAVWDKLLAEEERNRIEGVGQVDRDRPKVVALSSSDSDKQALQAAPAFHDGIARLRAAKANSSATSFFSPVAFSSGNDSSLTDAGNASRVMPNSSLMAISRSLYLIPETRFNSIRISRRRTHTLPKTAAGQARALMVSTMGGREVHFAR